MGAIEVKEIESVLPYFLKHKNVWAKYDSEVDTLYLYFKKPNHADDSELTDDEIIVRYEKEEVVGLPVLNVSKRNLVV